jgi:hypothetical protein
LIPLADESSATVVNAPIILTNASVTNGTVPIILVLADNCNPISDAYSHCTVAE